MKWLLWQWTLGHFHTENASCCDPVIQQVHQVSASTRTQAPTETPSALSPAAAAALLQQQLGPPSPGHSPPSDHSTRPSFQQNSSFPEGLPPSWCKGEENIFTVLRHFKVYLTRELTVILKLREEEEPWGFFWLSEMWGFTKMIYGLNSAVRRVFSAWARKWNWMVLKVWSWK